MPSFSYVAVDAAGVRMRGGADSANTALLARELQARGLCLVHADATPNATAGVRHSGTGSRQALLEITRAIAALLPAGMPLGRALSAATSVSSGGMAEALGLVRARVERGDALAAAFAEHPALFPPIYVGMVRAGERSGDLAGAFSRLSSQLEREDALRARLISASVYPMLLAGVGGIAVIVLMLFVIPRFAELLEGSGAALPSSTAFLLSLASAMRRGWPLLLVLPVAGASAAAWCRKTERGQRAFSHLLLALPFVRPLRRHALAARFARLTGVLLGGGAPLLAALDDALLSITDPIARDEIARLRGRLREGVSLRASLAEGTLFPPLLGQLVAVGEESGRLRDFLLEAAGILEERTDRALQRLVALAEPAMIVGFGSVVGFVALSLLQAIYSVNAGSFR